jgi:hypothetical protein
LRPVFSSTAPIAPRRAVAQIIAWVRSGGDEPEGQLSPTLGKLPSEDVPTARGAGRRSERRPKGGVHDTPSLKERPDMRSILLMFLGVPLPIILLLAFCTHHF